MCLAVALYWILLLHADFHLMALLPVTSHALPAEQQPFNTTLYTAKHRQLIVVVIVVVVVILQTFANFSLNFNTSNTPTNTPPLNEATFGRHSGSSLLLFLIFKNRGKPTFICVEHCLSLSRTQHLFSACFTFFLLLFFVLLFFKRAKQSSLLCVYILHVSSFRRLPLLSSIHCTQRPSLAWVVTSVSVVPPHVCTTVLLRVIVVLLECSREQIFNQCLAKRFR